MSSPLATFTTSFTFDVSFSSPRIIIFPFEVTSIVFSFPAAISTIVFPFKSSFVGISNVFVSPVPNCPLLLLPHVYTCPYASNATACLEPVAILVILFKDFID